MPVLARIGLRNARGHIASRGKTSVLAVIQLEIGHAKSSYLLAIESQITKKKIQKREDKKCVHLFCSRLQNFDQGGLNKNRWSGSDEKKLLLSLRN